MPVLTKDIEISKGRIIMKKKVVVLIILAVVALAVLSGCVPGDGSITSAKPAGFLWGIWHGWLAPVSLIWGLFDSNIRVYERINTGWWYDLGFYMAIISGFGSISLVRKKGSKAKD